MKKLSESGQLRGGVILSYLSEGLGILTGLIYTPLMLSLAGQSEYGLYQLVYSTVAYLSLIGLGFSSSYQRYYSRTKAAENAQAENGESPARSGAEEAKIGMPGLNGMFLIVFLAMSLICLLCGTVMVFNTEKLFGNKLAPEELERAKVLLAFMVFNMALTFPNSLFTSNIIAHRKFIFQKLVLLAHQVFNPLLCIPLLFMGYGSIGMVFASTVIAVVSFGLNLYYAVSKLKLRVSFRNIRFSLLKDVWGFTFFIFLNQIVNQINWNVDKYLLGRYCGTVVVAIYGIGGQLRGYFSQFSSAISNVFIPKVNQIVAETDDNHALSRLFTRVGRTQAYVIFLIVSGFAFFGKCFIHLWAGKEYDESFTIAMMFFAVLVVPYIQNLGTEIQRAKNKHRVRSVVYAVMSVMNILISIPLIKAYGATGAAAGTVISIVLCAIVFMNIYYAKYIGLEILDFWKNIATMLPGLLPPVLAGFAINRWIRPHSWLTLGAAIVLYTAVYAVSMYFISMNATEKNMIQKIFRRIRRKKPERKESEE